MKTRFLRRVSTLRAVKYRPVFAGCVVVASQLVAGAVWFAFPHHYQAEALVLLNTAPSPVQVAANDLNANVVAAKLGLLSSRLLTDRVIASLPPPITNVFKDSWASMESEKPPFDEWMALVVNGGLVPSGQRGSYLIRVGYTSTIPEFCPIMANLYAKELVALSDLLNRGFDRYADQTFAEAEVRLRGELLASQKTLASSASKDVMLDSLMSDPATRQFLKSSLQASRSVSTFIQAQAANPIVTQGGDNSALRDDSYLVAQRASLSNLKGQRAEAVTNMGDSHPVVKALDSSIRNIEKGIEIYESKKRQSYQVGMRSQGQTATQLADQEASLKSALLDRGQKFKAYESQMEVVEAVGQRYEDAMTQHSLMLLNRDVPRTDMHVVAAATLPVEAWFPSWYYYFPICLGLGLINAVIGANILERRDRRIRSVDDVMAVVGVELVDTLSTRN